MPARDSTSANCFTNALLLLFLTIMIGETVEVHTSVPKDIVSILWNRTLYDRHASPTQYDGIPTNVSITMYIEGLSSFKAQSMDFHVDIYFQERWADSRLRHENKDRILVKDYAIFDSMWHPDLYFANAKQAEYHYVTAPNFLVWIWPNGTVYLDTRVSLTVMCMMDLAKYPLDTQRCDIRILSYAYTMEQLQIFWRDEVEPISKNPKIKLPDMHLVKIDSGYCNGDYEQGIWSCALAVFTVRREIMHHILQSYIPTALIVVISWFSFWLDVDAVPGRVSLCITTLLTLATQASAARLALPQVSYIKAIDVWMGTCLAFVFGVMIEFTLVNYLSRRKPFNNLKSLGEGAPAAGSRGPPELSMGEDTRQRMLNSANSHFVPSANCVGPCNNSAGSHSPIKALYQGQFETSFQDNCLIQRRHNALFGTTTSATELIPDSNPWSCGDDTVVTSPGFTPISPPRTFEIPFRPAYRVRNRKIAQRIDRWCRVVFPVAFSSFNITYWVYYTFSPDAHLETEFVV